MKVAVFLPNWVGDVVMATPALRALRNLPATTQLIALGKPYISDVLRGSPWFDQFITLDSRGPRQNRWAHAAWQLRQHRTNLAVLFPNSFRSALVAWLGGCQRRIGFSRYGRGALLTTGPQPQRDEHGKYRPTPIIDDYNRLAKVVGCANPGHRMELFTTPEDERHADLVLRKLRLDRCAEFVCLNPGAAFGAAKHWSAESFAEVGQRLVDARQCGVLVLCGPKERDIARRITQLAQRSAVVSLADEALSLGLTKALVRRCSLLVTTDSGPRHFAAAFDRPVVTLFGPTHIAWTETYFPKAIHLQKKVPCGPCQLRVCPTDHVCMTSLTSAEVLAAVNTLLHDFARSTRPERKAS